MVGGPAGFAASAAMAAAAARQVAKTLPCPDIQLRDVAGLTAQGLVSAVLQMSSAVCRSYWPIAVVSAVLSKRCRRAVVAAAVVDAVVDWFGRKAGLDNERQLIGLPAYILLRRLDDIAYGSGVWIGAVRERSLGALKPEIRK